MAVNLSLSNGEAQRLDQIANSITENGNRTEAVRRMMDVFEHSADIARDRAGMEVNEDESDIDTSEPLTLEEARKAAKAASSTQEKTDIIAAHLNHVADRAWDRSELNSLIKSVLDCHRVTAYDYIDRLATRNVICESPVRQLDIDDVRFELDLMDTDMSPRREHKINNADSVASLVDIDMPDYINPADEDAYWRQIWSSIYSGGDKITYEEGAVTYAAEDVASVTYEDYLDGRE